MLVLLPLVALLACKRSGSGSEQEIEASDHRSRIRIPAHWSSQTGLNDVADLQVGNRLRQEFLIVLTEPKEDFESMDVDRLLEHHVSGLEKGLSTTHRVPLATSGVGGYAARQLELHGTSDGLKVVYLVTALEGPKYFHGIIAWTVKSHWPEAKPMFERTLLAFQET